MHLHPCSSSAFVPRCQLWRQPAHNAASQQLQAPHHQTTCVQRSVGTEPPAQHMGDVVWECLSHATHAPQSAVKPAWLHDWLRLDSGGGSSVPWAAPVATGRQVGLPCSRPAGSTAGRQMTAGHGLAGLYGLSGRSALRTHLISPVQPMVLI